MEAQLSYLSDELKSTQNVVDNNGKIKQILEEVLKHWMLNYIKVTTSIYWQIYTADVCMLKEPFATHKIKMSLKILLSLKIQHS